MSAATSSPIETLRDGQLTKSAVAALSHAEIASLSPAEMLSIIEIADLPFHATMALSHQSVGTLRQLTHLASRCCRNQGY